MKKSSSAGGLKQVLGDLLMIAIVFVTLIAFNSTVLAVATISYAEVFDNNAVPIYRNVCGNQTTYPFSVENGTAEFLCLEQTNGDWIEVGICKGWSPNGTDPYHDIWLSTPYYFVERSLYGMLHYNCSLLGPAPTGILQNHNYRIFMITVSGVTSAFAFIDYVLKTSDSGWLSNGNYAVGATETHDTRDQMATHFFDVRGGTLWLYMQLFQNDYSHCDNSPPYNLNMVSDSEWTATGKGST